MTCGAQEPAEPVAGALHGTTTRAIFERAIDGVNTPELQVADDDYAVGELVEAVAHSPYRNSTLSSSSRTTRKTAPIMSTRIAASPLWPGLT